MNTLNNFMYGLLIIFICGITNYNIENNNWILKMIIIYVLLLILWLTTKSSKLLTEKMSLNPNKIIFEKIEDIENIGTGVIRFNKNRNSRINFELSEENENQIKCPDDLIKIKSNDDSYHFCSDDGKFGKDNNTCSLNPSNRKNYPICYNYPCPEGLKLVNQNSGGICKGKDETCILDSTKKSPYKICYTRPDYNVINNYDFNSNLTYNTKKNINLDGCKIECSKDIGCSFFTMHNDVCKMYNTISTPDDIKYKSGKKIYFKNPYNYLFEDDVTIDGNTIEEHKLHTVIDCESKCNNNNNCRSFAWGKNENFGDCILKDTSYNKKKEYNSQFDLYSRKYIYLDNKGSLCKNHVNNIDEEIKSAEQEINNSFENEIFNEQIKNDNRKKQLISDSTKDIKKRVINSYINQKNIIWNNINRNCNIIHITKEILNSTLVISNIQIYGINYINNNETLNLTKLPGTKIISTNYKFSNLSNLTDNNLNTTYTTNVEDNPKITIKFPNIVRIYKIIIYTDQYNVKNSIYPIKIELYKDNLFIKSAKIESKDKPLVLSKDPPELPTKDFTYQSRQITDFGDESNFRGWVDVSKNGLNYDYCRVVKDPETKTNMVSCATTLNNGEFNYNSKLNIDLGVKKTQYMKDESKNGRADFCRCVGKYPNSYVSCIEGKENAFGDEFVPFNKPSPCDGYTGEELSNFEINKDLKKKDSCRNNPEYLKKIKSKITTGYYNYKKNTYYLFKNTIFNNKKVVLITAIDRDSHRLRRGFPQIVTKNNWPNLPSDYYNSIDATLYVGNNSIVIFRDNTCVFYNLITQSSYIINYQTNQIEHLTDKTIDNPPEIRTMFPNFPFNRVTSASNIYPNMKEENEKMNIFYTVLERSITNTMPKKINTKNIINFYKLNPELLDKNNEKSKTKLKIMKKILCNSDVRSRNDIISKMYKLLCSYYIPPCNIYYNNQFINYSLTTDGISNTSIFEINNRTIPDYNYSEVGSVISFYDSSTLKYIIFHKDNYFINNTSSKKPVYKKISMDYPNIWKIQTNNLGKISNNIITFKFTQLNKLELPEEKLSNYNIQIKLYEKNASSEEKLLHYLEYNKPNEYLKNRNQKQILRNEKLPIKDFSIFYNKDLNPQLIFKIIINNINIATSIVYFDEFYKILLIRKTLLLKFRYNENENEKYKLLNKTKFFPELFIKL